MLLVIKFMIRRYYHFRTILPRTFYCDEKPLSRYGTIHEFDVHIFSSLFMLKFSVIASDYGAETNPG